MLNTHTQNTTTAKTSQAYYAQTSLLWDEKFRQWEILQMTETSSAHWQMLLAVWRKLTSRWAAVSSGRTRWQASTTRSHVPATQKVSKRGITDLKLLDRDRPCARLNQTCGSHHAAILLLIMSYKPASTIGQSNPSFHLWIKWQQS